MTDPSPAAAALLRLQRAGYKRLGVALPDFSRDGIARRDAASLAAIQPGGEMEQQLAANLAARGLDPARAATVLADARDAVAQIAARHTPLPEGDDWGLGDPRQMQILRTQQKRIEGLMLRGPPEIPPVIGPLLDRITLGTLPNGELNARACRVPGTAGASARYLVLFDPVFFDFFYHLSNAFSAAIDPEALKARATRFGEGDDGAVAADVIRWGDSRPLAALWAMLRAFIIDGVPPSAIKPYDDGAFSLAEAMRSSGVLFVVAHEYGHIINGDLNDGPTDRASWQAEFAADHTGWRLLDAILATEGVSPAARPAGAHLFFAGLMLIELARAALRTGEPQRIADLAANAAPKDGDSHPSAAARLGMLTQIVADRYPTPVARASAFFASLMLELVGQFWIRLQGGFLKLHADGIRPQPVWKGWDSFAQPEPD